jgi:hypothetical protein
MHRRTVAFFDMISQSATITSMCQCVPGSQKKRLGGLRALGSGQNQTDQHQQLERYQNVVDVRPRLIGTANIDDEVGSTDGRRISQCEMNANFSQAHPSRG